MDTASLFATIALLILLAVTSPSLGGSRQTFPSADQDRTLSGVN